jgi:hypothetical protein
MEQRNRLEVQARLREKSRAKALLLVVEFIVSPEIERVNRIGRRELFF